VGWLLLGSVPGVLLGSQVTVRLPDRLLRLALATVLVLSGIKLLDAPNVVLLAAAVAGVALLGAAAARPRAQPETP
jgi:hypothetical protein